MIDQNYETIARHFFDVVLQRQGADKIRSLLTDDVVTEIPRALLPEPVRGIDSVSNLYGNAVTFLDVPSLKYQVDNPASHEDRIYLTLEVQGQASDNGQEYNQSYIFLFRFRDEKICYIRECTDSKYAWDVFGGEVFGEGLNDFAEQRRNVPDDGRGGRA